MSNAAPNHVEELQRVPQSSPLGTVVPRTCSLPLPTRIAFVGNYLPRQCGIATFTTDLCAALAAEYGEGRLFAIPVNDPESSYQYPEQVRLELEQEDLASYERAAEFLNFNGNDLVCLQHEYGIYGGVAGRHILALLRKLKMPVVTTLHTVLRDPDPDQRSVLEEIARLSDRLIVMSEQAAQFLRDVYSVSGGKIDIIPHGVPDFQFMDPNYFKDRFGTEGKSVLADFRPFVAEQGNRKRDSSIARDSRKTSKRGLHCLRGHASAHPAARRRAISRRSASFGCAARRFIESDPREPLCERGRTC